MRSGYRLLAFGVAGMACAAGAAHAAPTVLITGGLYFPTPHFPMGANYFDAKNGYVPSSASNAKSTTVAIGAPTEFLFTDRVNADGADFTDKMLTIGDFTLDGAYSFVMTFTANRAHFFDNATLLPNSFGGTISVSGNTLTFTSPNSIGSGPAFRSAVITFLGTDAPLGTPEPATWALMITGFGMVGAAMRRARRVGTPIAAAA